MPEKTPVGEVTHYFANISVAVVKLSDSVKEGDMLLFEGATTSFEQKAESMQIEHKEIKEAGKGDAIGMKVKERVREGDMVFRITS